MSIVLNSYLSRLGLFIFFSFTTYQSLSQIKTCSDTSERIEYSLRSDYVLETFNVVQFAQGNTFHVASVIDTVLKKSMIMLAVMNQANSFVWQKMIVPETNLPKNIVYNVQQCGNGDFLLFINSFDPIQTSLSLFSLIRISVTGNIVSHVVVNRFVGLVDEGPISTPPMITDLPDGDLIVAMVLSKKSMSNNPYLIQVFRMKRDGSITWQRSWEFDANLYLTGMGTTTQSLVLSFNSSIQIGFGYNSFGLIKINLTNGSQQSSKLFRYPRDEVDINGFGFCPAKTKKLSENHFSTVLNSTHKRLIRVDYDTNLNVIATKSFLCSDPKIGFGDVQLNDNGTILGSSISFNGNDGNENFVFVVEDSLNIVSQTRIKFQQGFRPQLYHYANLQLDSKDILSLYVPFVNQHRNKWQQIRFNVGYVDSNCIGSPLSILSIENISFELISYPVNGLSSSNLYLTEGSVSQSNFIINKEVVCSSVKSYLLELGPNVSVCQNVSIQIRANSSFASYKWQGPFIVSGEHDSILFIKPQYSSDYRLTAKTNSGCVLRDTINAMVLNSPKIELGRDTSICDRASIQLEAGPSFSSYKWNTGDTLSKISVNEKGEYFVTARYFNGCYSYDTISILNVFKLPLAALKNKAVLCENQDDSLSAQSGYKEYHWNTGSTQNKIKVQFPGKYWVQIKDENGCENSDTTVIERIAPLPKDFAPKEQFICQYEKAFVEVQKDYISYLWSDGSIQRNSVYSRPGTYNVRVIDSNGCYAMEAFKITQKNCPNSIMFPNAFTPDNNGRNDRFVGLVKGNLQSYRLTVFNRWGQRVFFTTNPSFAWDGKLNGNKVGTGTFVWLCEFQFSGEEKKVIKGTVVLIQ